MGAIKFLILAFMLLVSGCGPKQEAALVEEAGSPEVKPAAVVKQAVDPATAGGVKGKVTFSGEAPPPQKISVQGNPECAAFHADGSIASEELLVKGGLVQNAFVYIKEGLEGSSFEPPKEAATIDNKQCIYVPHVTGVQVNQPVILLNSDPTLHNVHSYSKNSKAWNVGLPIQGMKQTKKFEAAEIMVALKCDVHPWMKGYIGVLPHPYFSVTGESGEFEIKNLPAGEYTIEVWHEKLGAQSQKVKIEPQAEQTIEFIFPR